MYSATTRPFRFLSYSVLFTFFLFIMLFSFVDSNHITNVSAETAFSDKMPNLTGEEAKEHLKKQGLYESLGEAMKMARYSIYPTKNAPLPDTKEAFEANNPRQAFATYFAKDGIHLVSKTKNNKWRVQMNMKGYGYGKNITKVEQTKTEVQRDKSRIEITKESRVESHGSRFQNPKSKIVEWYENSSSGLEQGWTLDQKPLNSANDKELNLVLELGGDLKAKLAVDKQAIYFHNDKGEAILRYDKLKSWDANNKPLVSRMELDNQTLSILVDDSEAKYPITIDPFFAQTKKLTASDAAAGDQFGRSVAISGDTAIVGSHLDDDTATDSGSAYIFERNTDGANMWGQVQKLVASDAAANDFFGFSVAISDDTAIVGSHLDDDTATDSGSAYIFERNTGGVNMWGQVQKLVADDAATGDQFGYAVSISGATAIAGSVTDDDTATNSGSAYIFERNIGGANMWGQVQKIVANDAAASDLFGWTVSISGDLAIVGAYLDDDDGSGSGSAYIFTRNADGADVWGQVQKIVASDAAGNDNFGYSVSISGDMAIVGALGNDDTGSSSGSAYIFERNMGGANMWGQVQKLVASDAAAADVFGRSVAISGDTAVVGASNDDDAGGFSGSAYIFERNMGGVNMWGQVQKVVANDATAGDFFGISVAISGDTAIVGAYLDEDGGSDSGSAYIYTNQFNNWQETTNKTSTDGTVGDNFGFSVAISGDTAVVGAVNGDSAVTGSGSAYIFERNRNGSNAWGQVAELNASDAAIGDLFGGSVAISGSTVVVGARRNQDMGTGTGASYVFERNQGGADNWGEVTKILASDATANANFGRSVAISNDTVIVGTPGEVSSSIVGSAYIFERNIGGADNWGQVKKMTASDGAIQEQFGFSVAISDDTAVVGARHDDANGMNSGSAYIFSRNAGGADNWSEFKKLLPTDGSSLDQFGISVSISNDTILVGSADGDGTMVSKGTAYIFERNQGGGDNWGEVTELVYSDALTVDDFGVSVAISGDHAIVGASGSDVVGMNNGVAYIFERNIGGADNWGQIKRLIASDTASGDQFGDSVSISNDTAVVGARTKDISALFKSSDLNTPDRGFSSMKTGKYNIPNLAGADQGGVYIFNAIAPPTAASATISGKVITNAARGIGKTFVTMNNLKGETFTTRTNQFGYFKFDNVLVGETYILSVQHKVYSFEPSSQAINVGGDITGIRFTGYTKSDLR